MSKLDSFLNPAELPYDIDEWKKLPFHLRAKKVCEAWAMQGFGAPPAVAIFYVLKIAFYIWMWFFFCSYSTELGERATVGAWWFKLEALGKAITWTILIEVLGMGGASGPLTGRYSPPFGGITYWLIPGTIKAPMIKMLGDKRNILDVLLYVALLVFLVRACIAPAVTPEVALPILILLPILGLLDRQIYLAARADIYFPSLFVFLFIGEAGGALQIIWFAIWFWAAFSKLTPTFTSVIAVMICNSPFLNFKFLKKMMFKNYPTDIRLSNTANYISHFGTVVEFSLPILLMTGTLLGWPYEIMFYCLVGMTAFHTFIFMNFPMGVPMEWNVIMVFGGWLLFGFNPELSPTAVSHPLLIGVLVVTCFILPIIGNFFPKYVSFLMSMRYYAGTWPYSVWFIKKGVDERLIASLQKRCNFESGEVRVIMVESPQLHNGRLHWRIHDAKDGFMEEGATYIKDLKEKMPYPTEKING